MSIINEHIKLFLKQLSIILLFILMFNNIIFANMKHSGIPYYSKLTIKECNNYGWCLYKKNKYIKKHEFQLTENKKQMRRGVYYPVYFYKQDKQSNKYIKILNDPLYTVDKELQHKKNQKSKVLFVKKELNTIVNKPNKLSNDDKKKSIPKHIESKYFISLLYGASKYNISSTNNDYINNSLDNNSNTIDIALGYNINKNYFFTMNMQYSQLSNISFLYLYNTLNYKIKNNILNPYIGILGGFAEANWINSPLLSSSNDDKNAKNIIFGFQAGMDYKIDTKYSVLLLTKHIRDNFNTNINNNEFIKHNYHNSILAGVKYDF